MNLAGRHRVVQIHPTLRCNLQCHHCYSQSGPHETLALTSDLAGAAVRSAASCGYEVLAISGGEPLMYPGLIELLDTARQAGLATTLTSNGTLLTPARIGELVGRLDLLTISVDGVPASHDRIRNRPGAFRLLEHRLPEVRASGIRFGFIFTLSQRNVHELEWLAAFAVGNGASLLQIHPLEMSGRAESEMAADHPDSIELGFAFAEALRLRERYSDVLYVHLDVASRPAVQQLTSELSTSDVPETLAEAVSPLVIEADGVVVPLTYGFPRSFALGSLHEADLPTLGERWLATRYTAYKSVLLHLDDDEVWSGPLPVVSIYEAAVSIAAGIPPIAV